jgi:hypothetical protein
MDTIATLITRGCSLKLELLGVVLKVFLSVEPGVQLLEDHGRDDVGREHDRLAIGCGALESPADIVNYIVDQLTVVIVKYRRASSWYSESATPSRYWTRMPWPDCSARYHEGRICRRRQVCWLRMFELRIELGASVGAWGSG